MAQERGYDLVEVAPMASPPVVKFLDFGQYKYELTKRDKENKRRQRSVTFKEVRLTPKIGSGDFETKVHRAIEFLEDGDRIKVTVRFRGRELTHPELGRNMLTRFTERDQGTRDAGAGTAARGQVDAPHGRIAAQAQGARGCRQGIPRANSPTRQASRPTTHRGRSRRTSRSPQPPHRKPARSRLQRRPTARLRRRRRQGPAPAPAAAASTEPAATPPAAARGSRGRTAPPAATGE